MEKNVVEIRNVQKYFRDSAKNRNFVLKKLNMTTASGSIFALMGASGCGKTTLLSCIMGVLKCDEGEIKLFGKYNGKDVSNRIGYMPQEIALMGELTIKEMIYFFGNVYQMDKEKLRERYKMLRNLLELPPDDRRIEDCSGGQQRRVSFAASLIHDPDLLILDEPTVGLDPILREKIWDFMANVTRTSKLAIIITTHYIEEAKQADRCGLMRNGILLAEDSPRAILEKYECQSLSQVFLRLCYEQAEGEKKIQTSPDFVEKVVINDEDHQVVDEYDDKTTRKYFSGQTMRALVTKNFLHIMRQPAGLISMLLIPGVTIALFLVTIGGNPYDLKLGIVNDEIANCDGISKNLTCDPTSLSCHFIDEIHDVVKIFYDDMTKAQDDLRNGQLMATIHINSYFSKTFEREFEEINEENVTQIDIVMDQSDYQLTLFMKQKLYESFSNFTKSLSQNCNIKNQFSAQPINFMKPIFGEFNDDFKKFMAPQMVLVVFFYVAACLSSSIFVDDRRAGIWNRTLLTGVKIEEMLVSHVILQSVMLILQLIEVILVVQFIFDFDNSEKILLVSIISILLQFSGMFFGMCVACAVDDMFKSQLLLTGIAQVMLILSGMYWPIEGVPKILQAVSYITPFSIPSLSFRNILMKNYGITKLFNGFLVPSVWILILFIGSLKILKSYKYSKN